ncbi:MAG TPA: hypothetical protein VKB39_00560, partial [Candidatus Baltobacteraceae bacterium]|nr:hypothetical protein [Candidatus Baltobacteraceae bacterium]
MNRWLARFLALVLTAAAVYLVIANVHGATIALETTLAAAVLAIATFLILWKRPQAALILNAVWLAGAFAASAWLTPAHQLPNLVASSQPSIQQQQSAPPATSGSSTNTTGNDTLSVAPSPLPSLKAPTGALSAPQAGFDYSYFIGPGTIDDGMTAGETGKSAASAVGKAVSAFSTATETPQSPQTTAAQSIRDAAAKIPESEYSLTALAQTLPNDPIAIYRFVRDGVDVDGYDGIMRGPLGTWMSRSGSPSDKLSLLAWLLVNKGIPLQFVRGTLSAPEQKRIADAANEPVPASGAFEDDRVRTAVEQYVRDGTTFASWASDQLQKANVPVGTAVRTPAARHYWVQIDRNGQVYDLDPTLPDMTEGQHLGTLDSTFKPWAILPDDEWHYAQIQVTAEFLDGTSQNVVTDTNKTE